MAESLERTRDCCYLVGDESNFNVPQCTNPRVYTAIYGKEPPENFSPVNIEVLATCQICRFYKPRLPKKSRLESITIYEQEKALGNKPTEFGQDLEW